MGLITLREGTADLEQVMNNLVTQQCYKYKNRLGATTIECDHP
jgi:hypothetical protein